MSVGKETVVCKCGLAEHDATLQGTRNSANRTQMTVMAQVRSPEVAGPKPDVDCYPISRFRTIELTRYIRYMLP